MLSVNYRGSTGFGKKFANAGEKEWGRKMHDDILDAADWAVKNKIADPDKIGIMGGSYGGYETLVAMTMSPDRFACGVDIVGPSNLITLLEDDSALLGTRPADVQGPRRRSGNRGGPEAAHRALAAHLCRSDPPAAA